MRADFPDALRGPLLASLLGGEDVAWALLDASGRVTECGGCWTRSIERAPKAGELLVERMEALEGLLPVGKEVERLERLELSNGHFVDIHLGPLGAQGAGAEQRSFVVLHDVSRQAHAESKLVRRANDLSLLRRALGKDLEVGRRELRHRVGRLFADADADPAEPHERNLWTACVRLDPALDPSDRLHWSRWIEEWLLERSAILQRRGSGCFLALFGLLPEEASPSRSALECLTELRETLERFGQGLVTFALSYGKTSVRLVPGDRLLWEGDCVQRAWRIARGANPGQLLVDGAAVEIDATLRRRCAPTGADRKTWIFVEGAREYPDPGSVLASLGFLVLRPVGGMMFQIEPPVPDWLDAVDAESIGGTKLVLDDTFPFLEVFMEEAQAVWDLTESDARYSGVWSQDDRMGAEINFEATALRTTSGGHYLLVQSIGRRVEVHRTLLERVHSSRLDLERQRKMLDRREVLLHCIVHDLRGPLANVVAAITALGSSLKSTGDEFQLEMVKLGTEQAERQDEMIRSLLEVFAAEIESLEGFETDPARAPDGIAAVREVGESFRQGFEQHGIQLEVEVDARAEAEGVRVVGRLDRLQRVLANLLENARRHSSAETTVRVGARVEAGGVRFEVTDQGPGVPEALAGILFDRFQRGTIGGAAGLGLFFCRTTVERWGGKIGHEPGPNGVGARFWFWLPLAR